jgi:hypothetical protein
MNPRQVSAKAIAKRAATPSRIPAGCAGMPTSGTSGKSRAPCRRAIDAPPRTLPRTIDERGTGETITP